MVEGWEDDFSGLSPLATCRSPLTGSQSNAAATSDWLWGDQKTQWAVQLDQMPLFRIGKHEAANRRDAVTAAAAPLWISDIRAGTQSGAGVCWNCLVSKSREMSCCWTSGLVASCAASSPKLIYFHQLLVFSPFMHITQRQIICLRERGQTGFAAVNVVTLPELHF